MSDVVRGPCEEAAGSEVSGRRATVSNGGQRAVERKVEKRDLEIGGDPRAPSHTSRLRRFLARPTVHLPSGRACPALSSFFLRRPSTRLRPSRVQRQNLAPRSPFTRVLDVRPRSKPTCTP